jgi:hypothetical protein
MKQKKRKNKRLEAEPVIGRITKYRGTEHAYLKGYTVKIIAVIKNSARTDYDPDADDQYITDEEALARAGGVTADDRVEVQPFLEKEGRYSFVSSDPMALDMECFRHLRRQPK